MVFHMHCLRTVTNKVQFTFNKHQDLRLTDFMSAAYFAVRHQKNSRPTFNFQVIVPYLSIFILHYSTALCSQKA